MDWSYWHEQTVCPVIGSVKSGLPVSQQDLAFGGPFDVAEHGDELRAPGGTVVDDVTAIGTEGGDGGADETLLYRD